MHQGYYKYFNAYFSMITLHVNYNYSRNKQVCIIYIWYFDVLASQKFLNVYCLLAIGPTSFPGLWGPQRTGNKVAISLYRLYNNVTSVCIFIGCWPSSIKGHTHRWCQIHVIICHQTSQNPSINPFNFYCIKQMYVWNCVYEL